MKNKDINALINKAGQWYKNTIIENHIKNTQKLVNAKEFKINEMLLPYLSVLYSGKMDAKNLAAVLILPRVFGPSITTSFGQNMQLFISDVLQDSFGSLVSGIDIEFIDQIDGEKKYAQLKLGPNTINYDDVTTIDSHFKSIKGLAKQNKVQLSGLVVGVLYGLDHELNANYKKLRDHHFYDVYCGADFWLRLTGDDKFFNKLVNEFVNQSKKIKSNEMLEDTILKLSQSKEIQDYVSRFNN
ncbi:restriction endonuclease [bacterium]|jgi:hypothetical protein|nr:restriction endonuclease [bacterium]